MHFFGNGMVKKKLLLELHLVSEAILKESFLNSSYRILHFSLCKQCWFFKTWHYQLSYIWSPLSWSALYIKVTLPRGAYKTNNFESFHRYLTTYLFLMFIAAYLVMHIRIPKFYSTLRFLNIRSIYKCCIRVWWGR